MIKNLKTDILIIGAGPAGLTAAIYAARSGKKALVLEGSHPSRLALGYELENYPGFLKINSQELLNKLREQAGFHGAEFLKEDAIALALEGHPKYITTKSAFIEARVVIIATGRPLTRKNLIKGEEEFTGRGVSYCATCDGPLYRGREVLAYGFSEEAAEEILELDQLGCKVKILPGKKIKPELASELEKLRVKGLTILEDYELKEIAGERRVQKVLVEKDQQIEEIPVSAVFIFRQIPAVSLFGKAGLTLDEHGNILVDRQQQTNLSGVFAAGDVTGWGLQVASAVGHGCVAAIQALSSLRKL